jgi:signal transduction histidine kinase
MEGPGFAIEDDRDRLADLGRIAGGLVHELKNPLGVVLLNAELLLTQAAGWTLPAAERERAEKRLRRIQESARSLQAVAQSFLAFARPLRPDPEAVDLNALIADLLEERRETLALAAIAVDFHPDPTLCLVAGDRQHLRSVLVNVVQNAIEALQERAQERRLVILTRSGHQSARVVIANNGPPLPERVAAHLFEPFTSTKETGTGLGLAIVRRLVEMHQGTIAVSSDPHQGVSFTFEFPSELGPAQGRRELPMPAAEATVHPPPGPPPPRPPRRRRRAADPPAETA